MSQSAEIQLKNKAHHLQFALKAVIKGQVLIFGQFACPLLFIEKFRLTALAEVMQGLPVTFQVFVDGVALVVWLQTLQHV